MKQLLDIFFISSCTIIRNNRCPGLYRVLMQCLGEKTMDQYEYFGKVNHSDIPANERFKEKLDFLALSQVRR